MRNKIKEIPVMAITSLRPIDEVKYSFQVMSYYIVTRSAKILNRERLSNKERKYSIGPFFTDLARTAGTLVIMTYNPN